MFFILTEKTSFNTVRYRGGILPVDEFSADAALEEAGAAVAGQDAVVLTAGRVSADHARQTRRVALDRAEVTHGDWRGHRR